MERDKYVYPYSFEEAKRLGEIAEWRKSFKLNQECSAAIDNAVRETFDGMHLDSDIAQNACREFGIERVKWVLANTLQHADWDGRYRPQNKEWAKETYISRNKNNDTTTSFVLRSHPEIVNGLADQFRKYYDSLNLYNRSHCRENSSGEDFTGQLLVLKPEILKDECKTPEDQLFYAENGFGCSPGSHGKVMGEFLIDGEETSFHRDDFLGIVKDEFLPEWAAEKLAELQPSEQNDGSDYDLTQI